MKTTSRFTIVIAIALLFSLNTSLVNATPLNFTLDPASSLVLAANFQGVDLVEQGAGSLSTTYSGTLAVDVDNTLTPTSIDFLSSVLVAANSGNWLPQAGGGPSPGNTGTAQPANYGAFASTGFLLAGDAFAALRNLEFNTTTPGGALAVAAGAFPSTQTFTITTGIVDFNIEGGVFVSGDADFDDLSTDSAVNAAASSTYSVAGSIATLTLPIDIDIDINDGDGTANVSGTLVATASLTTPGDFDTDGDVDGDDFLQWQRGFGTTFNAADLVNWETNYGTSPAVGAGFGVVPEPSSLALLAITLGLFTTRRTSLH